MRRMWLISGLLLAFQCVAEPSWLSIAGDSTQADADSIEIDAVPVLVKDNIRLMSVRVSRSKTRTSGDGIEFRSFQGLVEFDCQRKSARYTQAQFFREPLWRVPVRTVTYAHDDVRPMAFRGFEPNPHDRIVRAACAMRRAAS